jgi:Tfp pilus assembly protein PilX
MAAGVNSPLNNENGMALVIVILMLVIITILGIGAVQTSTTEVQLASNERRIVDEFYKAEGGLLDTLERTNVWLTDAFLLAGPTVASYTNSNVNFDGGAIDAVVEIRYIADPLTPAVGLSQAANNLPVSSHTCPPPAGSGYSMGKFEAHRYGVTATSVPGNTLAQSGVWKVFNKF